MSEREMLSLSSNVDFCTDILQNIAESKESQDLCSEDLQKHIKIYMLDLHSTVLKTDYLFPVFKSMLIASSLGCFVWSTCLSVSSFFY